MNVLSGDIGTSIVALNCGHIFFGAYTTFSTLVPKWFLGTQLVAPSLTPRLLTAAFAACSTSMTTASDKRSGEKAWVLG